MSLGHFQTGNNHGISITMLVYQRLSVFFLIFTAYLMRKTKKWQLPFFHNLEGCDGTVNSFPGLLASQYVSNFEAQTIVIENHSWRKNDIHITKRNAGIPSHVSVMDKRRLSLSGTFSAGPLTKKEVKADTPNIQTTR